MGIGGDLQQAALEQAAKKKTLTLPAAKPGEVVQGYVRGDGVLMGYRVIAEGTGVILHEEGVTEAAAPEIKVSEGMERLNAALNGLAVAAGLRQYKILYKRGKSPKWGTLRPLENKAIYDRPEVNDAIEYIRTRPAAQGVAVILGDEFFNIVSFTQEAEAPNAFTFQAPASEDSAALHGNADFADMAEGTVG